MNYPVACLFISYLRSISVPQLQSRLTGQNWLRWKDERWKEKAKESIFEIKLDLLYLVWLGYMVANDNANCVIQTQSPNISWMLCSTLLYGGALIDNEATFLISMWLSNVAAFWLHFLYCTGSAKSILYFIFIYATHPGKKIENNILMGIILSLSSLLINESSWPHVYWLCKCTQVCELTKGPPPCRPLCSCAPQLHYPLFC